jgi:indolepyruvate ferredoxin oxidoreductase
MPKAKVSLADKFDLSETHQILTGSQAIARLLLMQRARDTAAGLNTAGYVSGYRGSPIAGLEGTLQRLKPLLEKNHIVFQPGLNEDLAATALWGAQTAGWHKDGKHDGVFGVWYGKGPGVDRTGDVFRHANHAGTNPNGGVLALLGDDHTCESSTSAHQSEFAMMDAMIPVLNPAGVQEMLDYGIHAFALSRFASVWVGMKCVKDNIESTSTVDGRADRVQVVLPEIALPPDGIHIRGHELGLPKEARLHDYKMPAVRAYARANKLDKVVTSGGPNAKIGLISTGKSYLDLRQALDELGIDEVEANRLGIRIYKVAMVWPLEPEGIRAFAQVLDMIVVVEEKRSLIETQLKEILYGMANAPVVVGKHDENGNVLFSPKGALEPTDIAIATGERIIRCSGGKGELLKQRIGSLQQAKGNAVAHADLFARTPYFCAGCPHNTGTRVPDGSRAYAGIGCHYMAQWMERKTEGFTQMGGEGANWIGEAPFSKTKHIFQNIGDGTYIHSGSLAMRAAISAGVTMTFKVLYNDAVAMTGGQKLDGGITVGQIVNQALAEGARKVVVVTDEPWKYPASAGIPSSVGVFHRRDLDIVQKDLREIEGVTVLVYDQTCAAEKRRRRKKGEFPDPDKRVFINPAVCEGCGDCGQKSNCVAVLPLETELGRKRAIDQSACNKDFSCLNGFCPSFVTVHGAKVRKAKGAAGEGGLASMLGALPEPKLPSLEKPYAVMATGVGGTGVVTVSAVLGQAAHIAGLGFGAIDMTGLAQKGGSVACHMRFAAKSEDIHAIRIGAGMCDSIIGGDLVVTASAKVLDTVRPDHTMVVYNTYEMITGDFTRNPDLRVPGPDLRRTIDERVRKGVSIGLDAHHYAEKLFGDSIASNMFLTGMAYQLGTIPVPADAIEKAIELNGAAVKMNIEAFRFGRLAAHDRAALDRIAAPAASKEAARPKTLEDVIAFRAGWLTSYQDATLAQRYEARIARLRAAEAAKTPGRTGLAEAAAKGYFKLLAYKDEYEVARLWTDAATDAALDAQFEARGRVEFHLAPPLLSRVFRDKATGHPRKIALGQWMLPAFRLLAKGKRLRGTAWDVFGYTAERRLERQMIADFERVLDEIEQRLSPATHATAVALAALPEKIKGFGHVKHANWERTRTEEARLLAALRNPLEAPTRLAAE